MYNMTTDQQLEIARANLTANLDNITEYFVHMLINNPILIVAIIVFILIAVFWLVVYARIGVALYRAFKQISKKYHL